MQVTKTDIKNLILLEPVVFQDNRGIFFESYNRNTFHKYGITTEFVQDNISHSNFGTVRGLHFQEGNYAQAKLVRVIQGHILDVVVDLRASSPTFGKHYSTELSDINHRQLFVPRGFAHGFSVLSDKAIVEYKCDNFYNKASERSIIYNDSTLNINWRIKDNEVIISEKDKLAPSFETYVKSPCF